MDRRTDRPDGSGGASPTVVTARADGNDLVGDDQDSGVSDIITPPRQKPPQPTASAPAPAAAQDGSVSDGTPAGGLAVNGAPANGNSGTRSASANGGKDARPAGADATVADGVPALPADTVGSARGAKPKLSEEAADDTFSFSFDPSPSGSSGAGKDTGDPALSTAAGPLWSDDLSPTVSLETSAPGIPASGISALGISALGTAPSERPSSAASPSAAEPPAVSAAAFAWEMPDPPPNSPSSPARTFLRSEAAARNAPPKTSPSSPSPAPPTASSQARAGQSAGAGRVTVQKPPAKKSKQPKQKARQAHLTIARVEPWSVMKFSFVVSLVAFVILFVAVSVLYAVLSGLGVFGSLQHVVSSVTSSQNSQGVNAKAWFSASKVLGYTALLGAFDIVLITAMSTIGSVVYNLTSRLVGGVEVTLRETE